MVMYIPPRGCTAIGHSQSFPVCSNQQHSTQQCLKKKGIYLNVTVFINIIIPID